ncbi:uncharacterized protein LOC114318619 [Camellia sinensis]|uniref:uncharacterized protein LOC114318619 n=1 Tax=Camellia sinensis TaxID=4442 RepID=UPI001035E1A2|nr:uncharacterized protein LOC114318619 [Camellia sinensis]
MITQIDSEDTLSISKIAETEKSASAAEKRPTEAASSKSTRSKKPRLESATTSRSLKSDAPRAPPITIEDKPIRVGDSATDIKVGVTLSTALLLPKDLERNAKVSEYENFALMLQHSVQAFDIKKELVNKTKEAAGLLKTANAARKAQDEAEEKADAAEAVAKVLEVEKKEAEVKTAEAQAKLIVSLATKDAEIKAADEKAYAEGAADVREYYKKQVKQELAVPEDSRLREDSHIVLPFPPTPSQSEDEAESEEEAEAKEIEETKAAGAKSPTLNEQV